MNDERETRIRDLVDRFRQAARHEDMKRHAGFARFPWGSCTWASFALGQLLVKLEPEADWHLINASGPSSIQGHDWLEGDGLAVDVTADQFPGFEPYVGPVPAPLPDGYKPKQRIELGEWHRPHEEALHDLLRLMRPERQDQNGG